MRRIHFSETLHKTESELQATRGELPRTGGLPNHGFVVGRGPDFEQLPLMETLSDAVFHVAPQIYYGSLKQTLPWFEHNHKSPDSFLPGLQEQLENTQRAQPSEHPALVVLGCTAVGSFFYAAHRFSLGEAGLHFATPQNLAYRRFLATLTWESWLGGYLSFLDLCTLPQSRKEPLARALGRFAEQMHILRFALPIRVPRELSRQEVARRFGQPVALLWEMWKATLAMEESGHEEEFFKEHARWNQLGTRTNPASCSAASDTLFPGSHGVLPWECAHAVSELLLASVEKVAALSGVGLRYGLQDFTLTFSFPGNHEFTSRHHLVVPLFGRDKTALGAVRRVVESLPQRKGVQGWEFRDEQGVLWRPEWMERITVTPLALAMEWVRPVTLFEDLSARGRATTFSNNFSAREACKALCHATPESALPLALAPATDEHLPPGYYRYQHSLRPPVLLRQTAQADMGAFSTRPAFLESADGFDYFALTSPGGSALWARAATTSRREKGRSCEILGLFSTFVPEEI